MLLISLFEFQQNATLKKLKIYKNLKIKLQ